MKTLICFESTGRSLVVSKTVTASADYRRHEMFAGIELTIEPQDEHWGCDFSWEVSEGVIPFRFFDAVLSAVKKVVRECTAGDYLSRAVVRVVDGSFHAHDSSIRSYQVVTGMAMIRALKELGLYLE